MIPGFLIKDAIIINENCRFQGNLLTEGELIKKIFPGDLPADLDLQNITIINAAGHYLIPGVIDDQVHFREPGLTHKGDIFSESRAAVAGGVTSYMDMPNTIPQTTTQELLEEKYRRAAEVSVANYSFLMGTTNDNLNEVLKTDPGTVCGIKVFLGASTGNMLVNNHHTLKELFRHAPALIAVHCEEESVIKTNLERIHARFGEQIPFSFHPVIRDEEACYRSSAHAVELASCYGTRLHVFHLSTAREMELFRPGKIKEKKITAEVCVHHLWFSDKDYERLGSLIKWNPAIKYEKDREALWSALLNDKIDVVATDHAPHTLNEKNNCYLKAPSGGPLVQHSLVAMLEKSLSGKIQPEKVVEKMCHAPADLFRIRNRGYLREGYFADLLLVSPEKPWTVSKENILYKCGWSPFDGELFHHSVTHTFVNGELAWNNNQINPDVRGKRLLFG
jgi:dihydroorotase